MDRPSEMPSYMIRPSDGEKFVLANDAKYYLLSTLKRWPEHLHHGYTYSELANIGFTPAKEIGIKAFFTVRFE